MHILNLENYIFALPVPYMMAFLVVPWNCSLLYINVHYCLEFPHRTADLHENIPNNKSHRLLKP